MSTATATTTTSSINAAAAALDAATNALLGKTAHINTNEARGKDVKRLTDLGRHTDIVWIDPRIILIEDGFNPRNYDLPENRAHLDNLKALIKEEGTQQPLWVRYEQRPTGGVAIVIDGECRLRANLELIAEGVEIDSIPTLQKKAASPEDFCVLAMTANTGKNLSVWEVGGKYVYLAAQGWSEEKISAKVSKSVKFVKDAMELAYAPPEVKQMLSEQAVTPSLAIAEIKKNSGNGVAIVENLRAAANDATKQGKKIAKRDRAPSNTAAVKALIQEFLDSTVEDMKDDNNCVPAEKTFVRKLRKAMGWTAKDAAARAATAAG